MREIKFRLWSDNLKILYTPEMNDDIEHLWHIGMLIGGRMKIDDGDIVMQFVGLKDKNGKDIYEGDISQEGLVIKWNQLLCCFGLFSKNGMKREIMADIWDSKGNPAKWTYEEFEICGNIYENPELLK